MLQSHRQPLLVLLLLFCLVVCDEDEGYGAETLPVEQWIDPDNMVEPQSDKEKSFFSNLYSKTMDKLRPKSSEDKLNKMAGAVTSDLKAELLDCSTKLSYANQQLKTKEQVTCDMPHFKQLVRTLLGSITGLDPKAVIILHDQDRKRLNKFLNDEANVHDASEILIKSIDNSQHSASALRKSYELFNEYLNQANVIAFTFIGLAVSCIIIFECTTTLSARQQFLYLLVVCFMLSIPWEWYRLYKVAFASKQVDIMKNLPKQCRPDHELGPWESITLWWKSSFQFSDDPCAKYQEALVVDPLWEVTPSRAVAVTTTRFFVQPLEYIAEAAGKSFRVLFKEVPIQWQPFVFLAGLILFILCILLLSGVEVNLPFFRIGVGRGPNGNLNIPQLKHQVQELTGLVRQLTEQRAPAIGNVEEIDNRDHAMGQLEELVRVLNERNGRQEAQLGEIQAHLQQIKPGLPALRAEPVEHQDWEVVAPRRLHDERPRYQRPVEDTGASKSVEHVGPS